MTQLLPYAHTESDETTSLEIILKPGDECESGCFE